MEWPEGTLQLLRSADAVVEARLDVDSAVASQYVHAPQPTPFGHN